MNADSWLKVGIDLDSLHVEGKEIITERDKKTAYKLEKVLSTYPPEQELSFLFNSLIFTEN